VVQLFDVLSFDFAANIPREEDRLTALSNRRYSILVAPTGHPIKSAILTAPWSNSPYRADCHVNPTSAPRFMPHKAQSQQNAAS